MSDSNPKIIIDGNNVLNHGLYNVRLTQQKAILTNLIIIIDYWKKRGYEVISLVSAKMKYHIDNSLKFGKLVQQGVIIEVPAGTNDDLFILETAHILQALILSNDLFRQYSETYPEVCDKRVPFLIIKNRVIIPESHVLPMNTNYSVNEFSEEVTV